MSRLLLLFICMIWVAGATEPAVYRHPTDSFTLGVFLAGFAAVVAGVGVWSRLVARRVNARSFARSIQRLQWVVLASRVMFVAWFAAGVFAFGWANFVLHELRLEVLDSARLPGLIVGTLPVMLAWIGLCLAQFPLDRELRQQGLTESLLDGLPVHPPPKLAEYLIAHLRLQMLFTVLPVMLIAGMHDVLALGLLRGMQSGLPGDLGDPTGGLAQWGADVTRLGMTYDQLDGAIWFVAAGIVFVFAPEVLRRILQTSPMLEGPLRRRLEALCRRSGMKVRDILVWHTHYNVGNAAVMGLFPRFRYVLLSDLLLERMEDEQIEAVFAHEVGHVVHRHMAWYIVFFVGIMLGSFISASLLEEWSAQARVPTEAWVLLSLVMAAGGFWLIFGFLSRRFERQADVYAARIMEAARPTDGAIGAAALAPLIGGPPLRRRLGSTVFPTVGSYGANLFASALHRVATINNMPVMPRSRRGNSLIHHVGYCIGSLTDLAHDWLHGSIPSRMQYLRRMSDDPSATLRFDRVMARLYASLLFLLLSSAVCFSMLVR